MVARRGRIPGLKTNLIRSASINICLANQREIKTLDNFRCKKIFAVISFTRFGTGHLPRAGFVLSLLLQVSFCWRAPIYFYESRIRRAVAEINLIHLLLALFDLAR